MSQNYLRFRIIRIIEGLKDSFRLEKQTSTNA